jgi:general secretion pathway protein D
VEPNDVPIIGTEQLTTTVTVPSGNTVVLGGLISDSKTKNDAGIPGLSRIPLLGNLFKNTKNSQDRKELIVFIQPNVVNNENELHKWSHNEDLRTSVGAEVAETFPNEVKPLPPQQPKETRKSWIKRLFSSDIDRERRSEHNPVKGRP